MRKSTHKCLVDKKRKINRKIISWAKLKIARRSSRITAKLCEQLVSKVVEFCKIVITSVSEAYTSILREIWGGNKVFKCNEREP
ncbi:hypothetical protein Glove_22g24 [Diversispora epigaea]|uniref:Uncharacterized protein n=1 Tax=Diversispora epigaea TaxID=1348612 RepID=A0A397JLN5_9GLOM|nr:hypothetical protein Glove_22g24 [Diversispora epigaea]